MDVFLPGILYRKQETAASIVESLSKLGEPGASALELVMKTYSDRHIFAIGLYNTPNWGTCIDYFKRHTPKEIHPQAGITSHGPTGIARFSYEILLEMLEYLDITGLTAFAATCKFGHCEANKKINVHLEDFFHERDLKWEELRLTLAHTDAFLTGMAVNHLIFPPAAERTGVTATNLDVYLEEDKSMHLFERYLQVATKYNSRRKIRSEDPEAKKFKYRHSTLDFSITVHAFKNSKVEEAVARQRWTGTMNWLNARGLQLMYWHLTVEGFSMPNREYILLQESHHLDKLRNYKQELESNGIALIPYHDDDIEEQFVHDHPISMAHIAGQTNGICGNKYSCPSRLRSTKDALSFFALFQTQVLSTKKSFRGKSKGLAWSLGASGCDSTAAGYFYVNALQMDAHALDGIWNARYEHVVLED